MVPSAGCSGEKSDSASGMRSQRPFPLLCVERGSDYIVLYVARTQNFQNNQTVNMVTSLSIATYACRQNLIKIPRHQIYSEMLPELSAKIPQPQSLL